LHAGEELITKMVNAEYADGANILEVKKEETLIAALGRLEDKSTDLVVEIPENFSKVLLEYKLGNRPSPAVLKTYGDSSNVKYIMAAVWSDAMAWEFSGAITGEKGPLEFRAETIGSTESLNEFELYVPGLLALALMMLMFSAAASLIKEKDKGTIIRLRISKMTTFEWLSAVSLTQVFIGLLAVGLAYLTAFSLGYRSSGSLVAVGVVSLISTLGIMAISLLVAASLRTIFDLMTIGCFPFFILMFFSGGMLPIQDVRLFSLGSRIININDILPTTHTISALDKILNYRAGLGDCLFELGAIAFLTVVLFTAGVWIFSKRHMQAR
jgi:ABC-2 type transport system permease protein